LNSPSRKVQNNKTKQNKTKTNGRRERTHQTRFCKLYHTQLALI
jgi:hypothetical protein